MSLDVTARFLSAVLTTPARTLLKWFTSSRNTTTTSPVSMVSSQSGSWRTSPCKPSAIICKRRCALPEITSTLASLRNAPAWLQTSTWTEPTLNSLCPNSATSAQFRGRIASHLLSVRTCPSYQFCTRTSSTTSPTLSKETFSSKILVDSLKT